jgi:hypothetical protein
VVNEVPPSELVGTECFQIAAIILCWREKRNVRQGEKLRPNNLSKLSQEIHTLETLPLYLVWFALDTTDFPHHNPPCLLLRLRDEQEFPRCDRWG